MDIPFLKKITLPSFSLNWLSGRPSQIAGIDYGAYSAKVVEVKYEGERALLQTYGEIRNKLLLEKYSHATTFINQKDGDIAASIRQLLGEAHVKTHDIVFAVPAASSFITTIQFPNLSEKETTNAIPYEARKYVPIPIDEVVLDWDIIKKAVEKTDNTKILLVAVPKDVIEKFKRVSVLLGVRLQALEIETFSLVRALQTSDTAPVAIINYGHQNTTLAISHKNKLHHSHNLGRGSYELTRALVHGLGVNEERAESMKQEIGISDKLEEREITSIIIPLIETWFNELERTISLYSRKSSLVVQKIILTGAGSNLKGLIEHTATHFGVEVTQGNSFARIATPSILQPVLRSIGPRFAVAAGLALHDIAN